MVKYKVSKLTSKKLLAKDLYHLIPDYGNLLEAFRKAAKGRRNDPDVLSFRSNFYCNIQRLRQMFLNRGLILGDYHFFTIKAPKVRLICAASFQERVIHRAL
jgi:hypothetical protein